MNRYWVWGLTATFAAGVGGYALAGDPNMQPGQTTLVQSVQNLFTPKPKGPGPSAQTTPLTITAPLTPTVLSKCLKAEQDAYWRRISVCDALRKVAEEKGDTTLSRQADDLEQQASALYNARVAALGFPKTKTPYPEIITAVKIQEPATPQAAANLLIAPASPLPSVSTAAAREVNP